MKPLIDGSLGLASLILTILVFTAFEPLLPDPAFDGSWRYAVATAAARSMPFGRDLVFTFGPLGMLYSGFRLPSQDALYLGLHILLSVGLFAGFLLSARPAMRSALILLPIAVAASPTPDAIFFVLPFTLVSGCGARDLPLMLWRIAMVLLATSDGLLPLIKGTMSLPVIGCTAIAAGLLIRRRPVWAIVVPAITVASALGGWSIAGQRLTDMPVYLRTQWEVASGYTDAMSIFGPTSGVLAFLAFAAALVALWSTAAASGRKAATALACALVGFVAFKAGFVRDDGHSLISASALLLLGLLLLLHAPPRTAAIGLAFGIGGWAWIGRPYLDVSPRAVASRLAETVSGSARSVVQRGRYPDRTFAAFERRKMEIRDAFDTPDDRGTYDIYPIDQTALLASGLAWSPRPIVQSYSAYTPALAAMNAAHIEGEHAPENLLFSVQPLDDRYPTLDDGLTWPSIFSQYDYKGMTGDFAWLKRSTARHPAVVQTPFARREVRFGEDVAIPPTAPEAVWATIDFHPPLAGRLASLLFKRPILRIEVTNRRGETSSYRIVAGESAAGFLLSPSIASTRDFLALKFGDQDLLEGRQIASFRLCQDSTYPFWGEFVDVTLAPLSVAPDPADHDDLRGFIAAGRPLAELSVGGDCAMDAVDSRSPDEGPVHVASSPLIVEGWALLSAGRKQQNDGVHVALTDAAGNTSYAPSDKMGRVDLIRELELPSRTRAAFLSSLDIRTLHGTQTVHIVQDGPDGPLVCPNVATVILP